MYNKKIKTKPAKCQKIMWDNCAILVKKEAGLFLACFICFTTGMCQLVSAGSLLHTAVDAGQFFFDLFYRKSFDKLWDRLKVSGTAAGKFYMLYNISVQLHFNFAGAGPLCLINI